MILGLSFIATAKRIAANGKRNKRKSAFITNKFTAEYIELKSVITTQLENKDFSKSCITCPECSRSLKQFSAKDIEVDHCTYCNSFWLDKTELSTLLSIIVDIPSRALTSRESKIHCPHCSDKMREYVFKAPSNLLIDECQSCHGIYLENNELNRAFTIIKT